MSEPRYLRDDDPWYFSEDIHDMDFHLSYTWGVSFVSDLAPVVGRNGHRMVSLTKGYYLAIYFGEQDTNDLAETVVGKILKSPEVGHEINQNIRIYSDMAKSVCKDVTKEWLSTRTNDELRELYDGMMDAHIGLYRWGWVSNITDMFHDNFTNYLKGWLAERLPEEQVNSVMVALSVSDEKTVIHKEHEEFLDLVALQQSGASLDRVEEVIENHVAKYFYLKHVWIGAHGLYDADHYRAEIKKFIDSGESAAELKQKEHIQLLHMLEERDRVIQELKLEPKMVEVFKVYADFAASKLYRRDAQMYWCYKMGLLFAEIGERASVSLDMMRFMRPVEVREILKTNKVPGSLQQEINDQRSKYCLHYMEAGVDILLYGEEARALEADFPKPDDISAITQLKGHVACLGKVQGKVCIINSPADMMRMEPGDILVSLATNPDVVPAMKKAGAIVTEQGGITSHAAIVSRELGVPCVIGVKHATRVLKNGDLVEVDAQKGIITIL